MRKLALLLMSAVALSGLAERAAAQSSVTIYGLIDAGIVRESGAVTGPLTKQTSGISNGSRLGFKGSEDLGAGWSALFLLENGFQGDTGALGQGGLLFGRQSYLGLKSTDVGTVTVGRQFTPHYNTLIMLDPFQVGLSGAAINIIPFTGNSSSRMDNSLLYVSPGFAGITGELAYAFGEVAGSSSVQSQWGAALAYANGPINARLGFHYRNNDTPTTKTSGARDTLLAIVYDFGVLKAHLGYGIDQGVNSSLIRNTANAYGNGAPIASTDSRDLLAGITMPFGVHTFLASYIRKDDKTVRNQDASQWAVGYRYALSKRTDIYSSYAKINNRNGAGYTVGSAIEPGSGNVGFALGVRHMF